MENSYHVKSLVNLIQFSQSFKKIWEKTTMRMMHLRSPSPKEDISFTQEV